MKQKTPKTLVNTGFFALIQDQKFFLISTVSYVSTVSAATRPLYTAGASIYNKSREPKRAYKKEALNFSFTGLLQTIAQNRSKKGGSNADRGRTPGTAQSLPAGILQRTPQR
jgi:hypothetical protein